MDDLGENTMGIRGEKSNRRQFLKSAGTTAMLYPTMGTLSRTQQNELRIGVYGPFSGPASDIGAAMRQGANLAAQQINENGGVNGTTFNLFFGDSESEPGQGRSAVEFMLDNQNVDLIAGGFHSDVSLAVIEVTSTRGVPQMISNSVSAEINSRMEEEDMRNVFKMSPPSEAYGLGWRQFFDSLQESGDGYFPFEQQRVAMIGETTSYGTSVMDDTATALEESGWTVISRDEVPVDETDFTSLLTRIRTNQPDVVWAVQTAPSAAGNLMTQFQQLQFQNTHLMQTFTPSNPETIEIAGDAANGVLWLANIDIIPQFARDIGLIDAWQQAYGTDAIPGSSGGLPYDNIHLIAQAMEQIGGVDDLSVDSWESAVIGLEPYKGSAGFFDFTEDGPFHQALWGLETIPSLGYQIVDQQSNLVWPFRYAESEFDNSLYQ